MATSDFFRPDYSSAREAFLAADRGAGVRLTSHPLPDHRGPAGKPLAIDVAALGPAEPESLLLLISGTHGVEGLAGSGCQVGVLLDELHGALPVGCAAATRTTSISTATVSISAAPCPRTRPSTPSTKPCCRPVHTHPNGLFYGGCRTSWLLRTLERILAEHLGPACRRLAVIDLHTGLGPWGYGELIGSGSTGADAERLQRWYGAEVTQPGRGPSSSSVVSGSVSEFLRRLAPSLELTYLALEFGTRPIAQVLAAPRADAWLHALPERPTPHREAIRRQVRDAFLIDSPAWRAAIHGGGESRSRWRRWASPGPAARGIGRNAASC